MKSPCIDVKGIVTNNYVTPIAFHPDAFHPSLQIFDTLNKLIGKDEKKEEPQGKLGFGKLLGIGRKRA